MTRRMRSGTGGGYHLANRLDGGPLGDWCAVQDRRRLTMIGAQNGLSDKATALINSVSAMIPAAQL